MLEGRVVAAAVLVVSGAALLLSLAALHWLGAGRELEQHSGARQGLAVGREGQKTADSEDSPCSLLPDPGPCRGRVARWYHLPRIKVCHQ